MLRELLALGATELRPAMDGAAGLIARALGAEKVDVFLYEAAAETLVAFGMLDTPLGRRQRATGLDRLPLASGGLTVKAFRTGASYLTGHADRESDERQDMVEALEIRSEILCRIEVDGDALGVLQVASTRPDWFSEADLRFLETAARRVGLVARRTELVEEIARDAVRAGRRLAEEVRRLTRREQEVAALVAGGLTNEEIAERLVVVRGTVSNHVVHILRKLGFVRRAQIAAWAAQHGLWTPAED